MIRHRYEAWNTYFGIGAQGAAARRKAEADRKRKEAQARAAAQAAAAARPPAPPNEVFIRKNFPTLTERSEPEWQTLLNARVKPYEDALAKSKQMELGQAEFQFEQAEAANKGLGLAFANLLTGGKPGEEGAQYAKENFGGQYLPLQAVSIAASHLSKLTSDWDERNWEISTQYQKAIAEIPGFKEELRASIQNADTDEYTRKFNYANLMLDEAWNVYNANAKQYNTEQQLKAAEDAIRQQQGGGYPARKDAVAEAAKQTVITKTIWGVRKRSDGTWEAWNTNKKQPGSSGKGNSVSQKNAALREASDLTRVNKTIWRVRQTKGGGWEAYDTGVKKTGKPPAKGLSEAQKAENTLLSEFYADRERYIGETVENPQKDNVGAPPTIQKGGLTYEQAYAQLFPYVFEILSKYGRSKIYIDKWVKQRLYALYPDAKPSAATAAKPRGG